MQVSSRGLRILFNLFLLYISWGSTYICLKLCMHACGPFTLCGVRMLCGGLLLAVLLALSGRWRQPRGADWRHAAWLAVFMVLMASGFLARGQQGISSSTAAIITASTPISMLLAGWLFAGEKRPTLMQCVGLLGGGAGLILLALGRAETQAGTLPAQGDSVAGMIWVFAATWGWVAGTLVSRRFPHASGLSGMQSCALLLICGGLESLLVAACAGEAALLQPGEIGAAELFAFGWLTVGGSIIAYYAYFWLLSHASIATAVSYEYVVPVIGVFLGWHIGGEAVTWRILPTCVLIVGSVFFVMWDKHNK